jgi:hypothetical protein
MPKESLPEIVVHNKRKGKSSFEHVGDIIGKDYEGSWDVVGRAIKLEDGTEIQLADGVEILRIMDFDEDDDILPGSNLN